MNGTWKIVGIIVAAAAIVVIAVAWYWHSGNNANTAVAPGIGTVGSNSGGSVAPSSPTRAPVPSGVIVPNAGATGTLAGVAVPAIQSPGDPEGNVSYRSFNIVIKNGAFSPSTIAVREGDTVNLEITAADANYSFTQPDYGFNKPIAKGKTQIIQFQALESGDFTFYCGSCGGPSKGPVGHLIVTAS
jgi:heme/copper-type cytochrome/quinol oxidase subunit 2